MIDDENDQLFRHIKYTEEDKKHWAYSSETENDYIIRKNLSEKRRGRNYFWKVFVCVNFILLCVTFCSSVYGAECSKWYGLSDNQQKVAEWLYKRGESHDLQLTLPAIAWAESALGRYRLNIRSGDVGLMQINYKTAQNTLGVTNYFKQAELHQRLIYDDELNVTIALSVLEHFKKVHKGDWKKMVMSYNIGNRKSVEAVSRGEDYHKKLYIYLKIIRSCMDV